MLWQIQGDARQIPLRKESVQCVVTSPPYYGLRNYQIHGQIGLEHTHLDYVETIVQVFREVRRVLKLDGTVWLNVGDSFASGKGTCYNPGNTSSFNVHLKAQNVHPIDRGNKSTLAAIGLKPKDLIGVPWRIAFALQADGWWLRSDIWDAMEKSEQQQNGANARSVWWIATQGTPLAHFATFPEALVRPCILAGSRPGDLVLDPFAGTGTVGKVALEHGRKAVMMDLNYDYLRLDQRKRHPQIGMGI